MAWRNHVPRTWASTNKRGRRDIQMMMVEGQFERVRGQDSRKAVPIREQEKDKRTERRGKMGSLS